MKKRVSTEKPKLSFILFIPLIIIVLLIIILLVILIKRRRAAAQNPLQNIPQWQQNIINQNENNPINNDNPTEQLRGEARLQHAQAIRQRALERAANARGETINNMDNVNVNEENEEVEEEPIHIKKIGKKKAEKLRRKEQRQQYFQWIEAQREHKRERDKLREEDMKKRKAKEMKRIAKEEEKEMKIKEKLRKQEEELRKEQERRRKEEEERDQLMISMTPEIISYLENNNPISMEALASHFNFRVDKIHKLVKDLLKNGYIFGTFNLNGDYIQIQDTQMHQLSQYISRLNTTSSHGSRSKRSEKEGKEEEEEDRIPQEVFIQACQTLLLNSDKANSSSSREELLEVAKENVPTNYERNTGDEKDQHMTLRKPWKGKEVF